MSVAWGKAQQRVEHILQLLARREYVAKYKHDRYGALDFEAAWVAVFEAFYGPNPLPVSYPLPKLDVPPLPPRTKTAYQVRNEARPCRKVCGARLAWVYSDDLGQMVSLAFELLECGHEYPGSLVNDIGKPGKWRRCEECIAQPPKKRVQRALEVAA